MNRKPAAVAPRTWHSLWDEMFSAVVELNSELDLDLGDEASAAEHAGPRPKSDLELLGSMTQVSNDNARCR